MSAQADVLELTSVRHTEADSALVQNVRRRLVRNASSKRWHRALTRQLEVHKVGVSCASSPERWSRHGDASPQADWRLSLRAAVKLTAAL